MSTKQKKHSEVNQSHQIIIQASSHSRDIDFNSHEIKSEMDKVRERIQTVLDNANIDPQKLSTPFNV